MIGGWQMYGLWGMSCPYIWHLTIMASQELLVFKGLRCEYWLAVEKSKHYSQIICWMSRLKGAICLVIHDCCIWHKASYTGTFRYSLSFWNVHSFAFIFTGVQPLITSSNPFNVHLLELDSVPLDNIFAYTLLILNNLSATLPVVSSFHIMSP